MFIFKHTRSRLVNIDGGGRVQTGVDPDEHREIENDQHTYFNIVKICERYVIL